MKKTILIFILFATSFIVQAQDQTSEYGVVFISRMEARTESLQTVGIHSINFHNDYFYFHPNPSYIPIIRREDFFYIHPNLTTKKFDFFFNSNHRGCDISYVLSYDLNFNRSDSNQEVDFNGCFASTFPIFIHLPPPGPDNSRCIEDVIDLSSGWNWQYRFNGEGWLDFPEDFQMSRDISFKIKDLLGYDGKTKIDFRTGYKTQFTNFISYNIIPCSPEVAGTVPVLTSCAYTNDGAVTVNLTRDLFKGEELVNKSLKNKDSVPIPILLKEINASQFSLSNLEKGSYKFKYQTRMLINGVEANSAPVETTFSIDSPSPLKFGLSYSHPKCYTDKGNVTITATGGTPPYFYRVGTNTEVEFPKKTENNTTIYSNTVPILVEDGAHKIVVRDNKNCIEKQP
jgi:hypothetical protein